MNLVELVDKIQNFQGEVPSGFFCTDGFPRSYMELMGYDGNGLMQPLRITYRSFAFSTLGHLGDEEVESRLCNALWTDMLALRENFANRCRINLHPDATPILFWRKKPMLETWWANAGVTSIYTRLAIPGLVSADYNVRSFKAEGAEVLRI